MPDPLSLPPDDLARLWEIMDRIKELAVAPDFYGGTVQQEWHALVAELDALGV
jgi:hypothetical protein